MNTQKQELKDYLLMKYNEYNSIAEEVMTIDEESSVAYYRLAEAYHSQYLEI